MPQANIFACVDAASKNTGSEAHYSGSSLGSSQSDDTVRLACDSPTPAISPEAAEVQPAEGGWFSRCRGCGWMTSHQCPVGDVVEVPCCRRCEGTITRQGEQQKERLLQALLCVHSAWRKAGV